MSNKNATKKLHHPQNIENAYSTPRWLSQVSCKLLSFGAKALYCRLKTWALNDGICYRSAENLSKELGISERQLQRYVKELKDCELIGTFVNQYGGVNNFEFYEHDWMFLPVIEELLYKDEKPKSNDKVRHMCRTSNDTCVASDTTHVSCINIKEPKINTSSSISTSKSTPTPITPVELIKVFQEEMPDNPCDVFRTNGKTIYKPIKEKIMIFKHHWFEEHREELTIDTFREYLQIMKDEYPGFCTREHSPAEGVKKSRNGISVFINPDNFSKAKKGSFY